MHFCLAVAIVENLGSKILTRQSNRLNILISPFGSTIKCRTEKNSMPRNPWEIEV